MRAPGSLETWVGVSALSPSEEPAGSSGSPSPTPQLIYMHWMNTVVNYCGPFEYEADYCEKLKSFLETNLEWVQKEVERNKYSAYWHQVGVAACSVGWGCSGDLPLLVQLATRLSPAPLASPFLSIVSPSLLTHLPFIHLSNLHLSFLPSVHPSIPPRDGAPAVPPSLPVSEPVLPSHCHCGSLSACAFTGIRGRWLD